MKDTFYNAVLLLLLLASCSHDPKEKGIEGDDREKVLTYTGTVVDRDDSPLENVGVLCESLRGDAISSETDIHGVFTVRGLRSLGRYTLTFSKDGYYDTSSRIVMSDRDKSGDVYILDPLPSVVVDEKIDIEPDVLDFGSSASEIVMTVSATLREEVEWHVTIADASWLIAEPMSGTLSPGDVLSVRFSVDRHELKSLVFQLITITVGDVVIPVMAECSAT